MYRLGLWWAYMLDDIHQFIQISFYLLQYFISWHQLFFKLFFPTHFTFTHTHTHTHILNVEFDVAKCMMIWIVCHFVTLFIITIIIIHSIGKCFITIQCPFNGIQFMPLWFWCAVDYKELTTIFTQSHINKIQIKIVLNH